MFKKILLATLLLFAVTACGSNTAEPTDLTGSWSTQANPDFTMTAVVSNNDIEVTWEAPDTSALYWKGTFNASASEGSTITSDGDTETMSMSLLASQSESKDFLYDDDKIAFDFTIMGTTTTLYLERD